MKKWINKTTSIFLCFVFSIVAIGCLFECPLRVSAATKTENVIGEYYQLGGKDDYNFSSISSTSDTSSNSFGSLKITGDMTTGTNNGITSYDIKQDNFTLSYEYDLNKLNAAETSWHLYDDKIKKLEVCTLDENMLKGALVMQTSLDGQNWVTDHYASNIFADSTKATDFFTSKDIQLVNGCYYRIIVAYKLEMRLADTKNFIGITEKNYDYKRCIEVYEFYAVNSTAKAESNITNSPRKTLGSKVEVKKDNGYDGDVVIGTKDPHYGWDIGKFFINGYTSETTKNGCPVFLKNLGDKVTLWFNLSQDINCLNGKSNLVISGDKKGYDHYFETKPTDFKRGALIIRHTDFEGIEHDPIIYTDFLAANATTGADTRVVLFEEGDYEVALDYKICDKSGIDSYTDYRIYFTFSIRNSNCMVYPFDIKTNSELSDGNITPNGFRLDMAKSRYLTVTVTKEALKTGTGGHYTDTRFNGAAKDGESYTDEGIYTFDVENLYTGQHTVKTIYVGTDPFLKAMSVTGLSIKEIDSKLSDGYTINDDGTLEAPVIVVEETEDLTEKIIENDINEKKETESTSNNKAEIKEEVVETNETQSVSESTIEEDDSSVSEDAISTTTNNNISGFVIVILICIAGVVGYLFAKKKPTQGVDKKDDKEDAE